MFNGKIHYKWAMFNSYVTNYQRVCSIIQNGFLGVINLTGFFGGKAELTHDRNMY